jgi:diguanylate cyclase (GGDEF)-like protein
MISLIFVVTKRVFFQKKQFWSIIIFFIAPFAGTTIQVFDYGVSYNWTGVMISLLIIYFSFQSRNLNTDYLTGVNNRMHFQGYIKAKIRGTSEKRTFGAIMIDIDNFKKINDSFGHATGDEALKDAVGILKDSLRRDDFIARFGGDEFLIIIDVQTQKMLEDAIKRIRDKTELFNAQSRKPYRLSFSFGSDIYNVETKTKPDDFISHLDRLMYEDKNRKMNG